MGIDPGLARVGYGAVLQNGSSLRALTYGCVEDAIQAQIDFCEPEFLSVERLFFGRNTTTAEYVFQARGVIMLLAAKNNLPVIEPKPNQIKLALCGVGAAEKIQVQKMVQRFLALDEIPRPDDTADALAAAITGLSLFR